MLFTFGLPLILAPMSFLRLFRWEIPEQKALAISLGRSLGVFIAIMAIFAFKAAQTPAAQLFFFDLMLWIFGAMLLLHIYGALRKVQPVLETAEIFMWLVLGLVTLGFYPA
ncbi:MAG: hypothetical protein C3F13_13475 [Anaerolineales bacterium]|nr:MAG: hypothetical protein C3F13_13475 [Anaerolineales bacterium]